MLQLTGERVQRKKERERRGREERSSCSKKEMWGRIAVLQVEEKKKRYERRESYHENRRDKEGRSRDRGKKGKGKRNEKEGMR